MKRLTKTEIDNVLNEFEEKSNELNLVDEDTLFIEELLIQIMKENNLKELNVNGHKVTLQGG